MTETVWRPFNLPDTRDKALKHRKDKIQKMSKKQKQKQIQLIDKLVICNDIINEIVIKKNIDALELNNMNFEYPSFYTDTFTNCKNIHEQISTLNTMNITTEAKLHLIRHAQEKYRKTKQKALISAIYNLVEAHHAEYKLEGLKFIESQIMPNN